MSDIRSDIITLLEKPRYLRSWEYARALYSLLPKKNKQLEATLARGETIMLWQKLEYEFRNVVDSLPKPLPPKKQETPAREIVQTAVCDDATVKAISDKINKLKALRAYHHARLSKVKSDEERYEEAKNVLRYVKEIDKAWDEWRMAKNGELPTESTAAQYVQKNSLYRLRVYVSRYKKKVNETTDPTKKAKYTELLEHYQNKLNQLQ